MIPSTALSGLKKSCQLGNTKSITGYFNRYQTLRQRNNEDLFLTALLSPKYRIVAKLSNLTDNTESYSEKVLDAAIQTNNQSIMKWINSKLHTDELVLSKWQTIRTSPHSNTIRYYLQNLVAATMEDFRIASPEGKKEMALFSNLYLSRDDVVYVSNSLGYIPESVFIAVSRNGEEFIDKSRVCSICRSKCKKGKTHFRINVCDTCQPIF